MYSNPVTEALEEYYKTQYDDDDDSPESEYAVLFDYGIPLAERRSKILAKVDKLLADGVDLNDAPDGEYPLMSAVSNLDVIMVRYLLERGADCRKWHAEGEEPEWYERNWYLEELDIRGFNFSFALIPGSAFMQALLDTICALVVHGGLQEPFYGYRIQVTEKREVICAPVRIKFF